jgi:raffinose/stachyose/melibiose transport system permease protein
MHFLVGLKKLILLSLKWFVLLFFLFVALLPMVWLLLNSFRSNLELQISSFGWPSRWLMSNYLNALRVASLGRLFTNSMIAAFSSVVFNVIICSLGGFVLSREVFKGRDVIYTALTAGVLIPILAFMVPYFSLITRLGLYNSIFALVLIYTAVNIPVSMFLTTSFMRSIPKELEEAAIIDGCSFFQRFYKIIFPLSQSGLVTAGTFCFIFSWNDFIMAMLMTSSIESRTIQLGIRYFMSQFITDYTSMFAAIVISVIPSVIVYLFFHNRIIAGLTAGSVKG